jgi:hypothetical protein
MTKRPTGTYTGLLVSKPFVNKVGRATGPEELHLRLSMGDFFIKFSESALSPDQLRPFLGEAVTVEGEIRHGAWDLGPGAPEEAQSRIGDYLVIRALR